MAQATKYQVQIFNMERFTNKGHLKAYVDIKIGKSLRIMGLRIIQQPNQKPWVSPPQRTWQDTNGLTKYAPIVELSGELKEAVDAAVLMEWARS